MSYSDFTLKKVKDKFQLRIIENEDLFSEIKSIEISEYLKETLKYNVPLATAVNTEKARSELIIANVLLALKKICQNQISFFSGINLEADREKELSGFCDYIISQSPEQFFLDAPIIAVVEAKNENIIKGFGQCVAEMLGSKIFNEKEGNQVVNVYGTVTTGSLWKFLKYEDEIVYIDLQEYHIKDVGKIMGILYSMVSEQS